MYSDQFLNFLYSYQKEDFKQSTIVEDKKEQENPKPLKTFKNIYMSVPINYENK